MPEAEEFWRFLLLSERFRNGLVVASTPNMTDPLEQTLPALLNATPEEIEKNPFMVNAPWHQATPALKLVLCDCSNITYP
jgi:hypothetical protein